MSRGYKNRKKRLAKERALNETYQSMSALVPRQLRTQTGRYTGPSNVKDVERRVFIGWDPAAPEGDHQVVTRIDADYRRLELGALGLPPEPRSPVDLSLSLQAQRKKWNAEGYCARVACGALHKRMKHPATGLFYCRSCAWKLNEAQGEGTVTYDPPAAVELPDAEPAHVHDCDACVFLGGATWEEARVGSARRFDLYLCPKTERSIGERFNSVIARFGPAGEYMSMPDLPSLRGANVSLKPLVLALQIAERKGLIPPGAPA